MKYMKKLTKTAPNASSHSQCIDPAQFKNNRAASLLEKYLDDAAQKEANKQICSHNSSASLHLSSKTLLFLSFHMHKQAQHTLIV